MDIHLVRLHIYQMCFLEGKLLAKYNILGILLSAPYFTMRDDPLIEIMYNPFLNS